MLQNDKETEGLKKFNTLSMMYETEANSGIWLNNAYEKYLYE